MLTEKPVLCPAPRADLAPFREAVTPLYQDYEEDQPAVYDLFRRVRSMDGATADTADTAAATAPN